MFGNKIMIHVSIKTFVYSNSCLLILNIRATTGKALSVILDILLFKLMKT